MHPKQTVWSLRVKELIKEIHVEVALNNKNWHQLKNDPNRRAAELLVSALGQIINQGEAYDIENLIEQSLLWIKRDIKDPGCPSH